MSQVAALIVTHNAEPWIQLLANSIAAQTRPPDSIVVVDDRSTDATIEIVRDVLGDRVTVIDAKATTTDRKTRIGQNFEQGLRTCMDSDVVIIGDHDDVWHDGRVDRQERLIRENPDVLMVASDGRLIDEMGAPVGGTLRTVFPVPPQWVTGSASQRMRATLRTSIATGGASAVRPAPLADVRVPEGWLHDRWWSLVATAKEAMLIDDEAVIDYRVTESQQVGLDRASQHRSRARRLMVGARQREVMRNRIRDITDDLRPLAHEATAPELSGWRLVRNLG